MKEMTLSLTMRITLTQRDVHWLEAELAEQRTRLFREALHRVGAEIEATALAAAACPTCGDPLVCNGNAWNSTGLWSTGFRSGWC